MTQYTVAITEVVEYLVPVDTDNEEIAEQAGFDLIESSPDRDRYFVCLRARECEGVNEGWSDDAGAVPKEAINTRLLALARTLANMTTPMDGLVQRDSMHVDMALAERSDETLCSDADALYRVIEEARTILDSAEG